MAIARARRGNIINIGSNRVKLDGTLVTKSLTFKGISPDESQIYMNDAVLTIPDNRNGDYVMITMKSLQLVGTLYIGDVRLVLDNVHLFKVLIQQEYQRRVEIRHMELLLKFSQITESIIANSHENDNVLQQCHFSRFYAINSLFIDSMVNISATEVDVKTEESNITASEILNSRDYMIGFYFRPGNSDEY